MSPQPTAIDARMRQYLEASGWREHPVARDLRLATDALPDAGMRSSTEQVALLAFLVETMNARHVLEIGCFTGYGTLSMALALPAGGRIVTLDINADWAEIGRRYWRRAGVEDRIELRLGLARNSLATLAREDAAGRFDLVYIDAEKKHYAEYFDQAMALVRPGGLIALDNMLWRGAVADASDTGRQTRVLRDLTSRIHADPRLAMVLLPIGDGLLLCRLRPELLTPD